ncbi:MAG: hypothetical protein VZS44_00700 [Bacilli bacterium]|nr:hypothetical protein [Bacilli bacterium]
MINSKEELLILLNQYEGILKKNMIEYLNSLIELEFSVIKEYISESDRKALSELEIYKKIAIYNIYNRALNLFNSQKGRYNIYGINHGNKGLKISKTIKDKSIDLFDFDYREIQSNKWNTTIPKHFKSLYIGDISLFQTIESKELREAELKRINDELERLYREPICLRPRRHSEKIKQYEKELTQLDSKKELDANDKREIKITKKFQELLLEDYGLTKDSFVDESNNPFVNFGKEKTKTNKNLVLKMPNLTIKDNIKYI